MRLIRSFLRIHSQHINMDLLFNQEIKHRSIMMAIIHTDNFAHSPGKGLAIFLLYDRAAKNSTLI